MAAILPEERWRRIEEVFAAALELPPANREAFVTRQCGADTELAAEVNSLLRNDIEADAEVVDALAAGAAAVVRDPLVGTQIGAWRIERQVGSGGMGAVYLVVRANGEFQQRAALKLIKRGMDTAAAWRRHPAGGRCKDGSGMPGCGVRGAFSPRPAHRPLLRRAPAFHRTPLRRVSKGL
jgi:hypothetical protein